MENASKALLIAGAILIILIIIGIAIAFISKTEVFTKMFSDNLSEEEIANHNAIFSIYDGPISGTQVNTLLSTAEANNAKSNIKIQILVDLTTTPSTPKKFAITIPGATLPTGYTSNNAGSIISDVDKTSIYTARIIYNGEGIIERIEIN